MQPFQFGAQAGIFSFQSLNAGVLSFRALPLSFGTAVCGLCGLFRRWHKHPSGGEKAQPVRRSALKAAFLDTEPEL